MPPGRRGKRGKKAPMESAGSSIDALPDGVLQHILGFLPAWDAVRTSVLARRWRDLWMFATGLRIIGNDDDDREALRESVDHLLLTRGIAPLETCELRFDSIANEFSGGDVIRVNLWFRHAIRCQVRVLRLVFTQPGQHFDLQVLHLISRHLMELELVSVEVKESFLNLLGCPALEQLAAEDCDLSLVKRILSVSLKRLSITSCIFSESFRTRIHTPSLVSLLLDDNWCNSPVLESMQSFVDASIRVVNESVDSCEHCDSGNCNSCNGIIHGNSNCILLEGLSKAKNLALIADSKTFIFRMDLKRCPTFSKLKTLLLSDYWCVALDLDAITCILKNSPFLEKLTLELCFKGSDHKMEMKGSYIPEQETTAISEHLKIIVVKCDVVDEKVYKVLKLLSTFNIRELQVRRKTLGA
ncbi:F-box/FBD/LRR-repeat protein At4g00160-like isoform X3 [Panicum virgatum]|uniref:F-box/FBD/LRR-repeat protein At4g00160-like isoform X3 n=1 Tax=Panicum virgatum TaxID=38727 RepID=UPI0019D63A42|nr:F-box/FBD/LRR-repeat protein At4g00160-like isoform X3 [Panicum virgatum]